jgi:hypothetical protein
MNRLLRILLAAVLISVAISVAAALPARGVPGPEEDSPEFFQISVTDESGPIIDELEFDTSTGWDFGDRVAYRCAWIEYFTSGSLDFTIHFNLTEYGARINDRFGLEGNQDVACGANNGGRATFDGSDHFPHGTAFRFDRGDQLARLDFDRGCAKGYWTPGDEAGEAWLWWDADGPEDRMMMGDGACDGGSGEPAAVLQASVQDVASDIRVCTVDSIDGNVCSGAAEPGPPPAPTGQHASSLTLKLTGDIRAFGSVKVADGTAECTRRRIVVIERRVAGDWRGAGKDRTNNDGRYAVKLHPREGTYRSRVLRETLANDDVCTAATSREQVYERS